VHLDFSHRTVTARYRDRTVQLPFFATWMDGDRAVPARQWPTWPNAPFHTPRIL